MFSLLIVGTAASNTREMYVNSVDEIAVENYMWKIRLFDVGKGRTPQLLPFHVKYTSIKRINPHCVDVTIFHRGIYEFSTSNSFRRRNGFLRVEKSSDLRHSFP